jgi:predicted O-methyltransferase YrrM
MNLYETDATLSQVDSELEGLIKILVDEKVTRFLEVGSRYGGSLWRIAKALPKGSIITSCDSGGGMGGNKEGAMESLVECIAKLREDGYHTHLIVGDSQKEDTIKAVLKHAPFDAAFIDADHEYRGVMRDWQNYGPHARIVAFHDIGWKKPPDYKQAKLVEVPQFWAEVKQKRRHQEFIDYSTGRTMGIGVLWR